MAGQTYLEFPVEFAQSGIQLGVIVRHGQQRRKSTTGEPLKRDKGQKGEVKDMTLQRDPLTVDAPEENDESLPGEGRPLLWIDWLQGAGANHNVTWRLRLGGNATCAVSPTRRGLQDWQRETR